MAKELSTTEKAALILLSLGKAPAAMVLQNLNENEVLDAHISHILSLSIKAMFLRKKLILLKG